MDYYSLYWGPEVISTIEEPRVRLRVGHQHSQLWPILVRFVHYYLLFFGTGVISMINELKPRVCLCAGQQDSQFWSILPRFMDYYSLF